MYFTSMTDWSIYSWVKLASSLIVTGSIVYFAFVHRGERVDPGEGAREVLSSESP